MEYKLITPSKAAYLFKHLQKEPYVALVDSDTVTAVVDGLTRSVTVTGELTPQRRAEIVADMQKSTY